MSIPNEPNRRLITQIGRGFALGLLFWLVSGEISPIPSLLYWFTLIVNEVAENEIRLDPRKWFPPPYKEVAGNLKGMPDANREKVRSP